jgi:multidrug resistance protein MdtO
MATAATAAPSAIDQGAEWFWDFLKKELTPYPGRLWVVGRMTISATLVMILIEVFRMPGGFQGALFTLLLSRENPRETFLSGLRTMVAFLIGTAYVVMTIMLMVDDPLTHFLWVAGSLFLFFYLLRVISDYGSSVAMGFAVMGAISLWDTNTLSVEIRLENTLWLAGQASLAVVVSIAVEYILRRFHPATDLTEGIENRLQTAEKVLRAAAEEKPLDGESEKSLALYSSVGTSRLRRLVIRSDYSDHFKSQMGTAISLLGRLVDTAASFRLALTQRASSGAGPIDDADRERLRKLADHVADLSRDLPLRRLPRQVALTANAAPSGLPFLPSMEQTAALIPEAFSGSEEINVLVPAPLAEEGPKPMFAGDAFSNPEYVQFALRGTLAAMVCYILYTALDWPGISTSVVTCYVTALSTIGSSRQKQVLRLAGAVIGGFIFGMGAQIFVLPHFETITGFTVVFALVTAIAAWFQTASARLSYLGVQLALAYYLIHLQEFTIQTSLAVARDRVVGVLVGLVSMGLFFDLLWVRKATEEMQVVFARNLNMFAELTEQLLEQDQIKAIKRIRSLRDQLNAGFEAVRAQSDAVLLEFGPSRQRKLEIREDIRRWSPAIRTLLQVQITSAQYLIQNPLKTLPAPIAEAGVAFERDIARVMRGMANEVSGKTAQPVPDVRTSADRFKQAVQDYYSGANLPVPPQASDLLGLARSLANILAPLYEDIHATFAGRKETLVAGRYIPSEAQS